MELSRGLKLLVSCTSDSNKITQISYYISIFQQLSIFLNLCLNHLHTIPRAKSIIIFPFPRRTDLARVPFSIRAHRSNMGLWIWIFNCIKFLTFRFHCSFEDTNLLLTRQVLMDLCIFVQSTDMAETFSFQQHSTTNQITHFNAAFYRPLN